MATVKELTFFIRKPGTSESIRCGACGSICDVRRDALGPTCFAEAMAGRSRLHDVFECPHIGKPWHDRCLIMHAAWKHIGDWSLAETAREELFALVEENAGPEGAEWVKSASMGAGGGARWQE